MNYTCYNTKCNHPYCAEIGMPMNECRDFVGKLTCEECGKEFAPNWIEGHTGYDEYNDPIEIKGHWTMNYRLCSECAEIGAQQAIDKHFSELDRFIFGDNADSIPNQIKEG